MEEGWEHERPPRLELRLDELTQLIEPAFPGETIARHSVLTSGLANTNVRFELKGRPAAYVLRIHTRDGTAALRERDLMKFLSSDSSVRVPVPPLLYSDPTPERGHHPYSIWGFVEGTLLQELFKTEPASQLVRMAEACGRTLATIAAHRFPTSGAFGAGLEIIEEYGDPSRFVPEAIQQALFQSVAGQRLGSELRDVLWQVVERTSPLLAQIDGRYALVHADYKRSNLLMQRGETGWAVSAVLDWEFACAGPPLIDVGLFLRAGAALPTGFRDAFAFGYREAGGELPSEWLRLSRLVDLISQLTFLSDPGEHPRVFAETTAVVKETLHILS